MVMRIADREPVLRWLHDGREYGAVLHHNDGSRIFDGTQLMVEEDGDWHWCGGIDSIVVSLLQRVYSRLKSERRARHGNV